MSEPTDDPTDRPADPDEAPAEPAYVPIDSRKLAVRLAPCLTLYVIATIGGYIGPTLVKHHPAVLLLIDARNRHLLFTVAAGLNPWSFFAIGFFRLVLPDPFFYLLGRDYGHRGVAWIERQTQGQTGYLGWIQRWFDRAADALIVIMPNTYVCLLSGMDRVHTRRMVPLDAVGTIGRLALFWWAGKQFQDQLKSLIELIARYQWVVVAALVGVSVVQNVVQQRRSST
jgi:membrane protein DedA with SNARE-associated domain